MKAIEEILREIRELAKEIQGNSISNAYELLMGLADRIEAAVKHQFRETTKTIPHEKVAVAENATTTPTCDKSSQVGNAAALRVALEVIRRDLWDLMGSSSESLRESLACKINATIRAALAAPARNCDVMSLESAKKLWFAKEILPRLDGDLPLGKEIPFEEWFVSQHEEGEQK
jgi:hypothetical protein